MSSDLILLDGDSALFLPAFGAAVVTVLPGQLRASGAASLRGKKVCVQGDESSVSVPGCVYVSGAFTVPGVGTLSIALLGGDQTASQTTSGGKAVLLKGSTFTAQFKVDAPALLPPPTSSPDPVPQYSGSGSFQTLNTDLRGT